MIRWWFLLGYCTVLLLGSYAIVVRSVPMLPFNYVAAADLKAGRLLQPGDLLSGPAADRYLLAPVRKGKPVQLEQAASLPLLRVTKDRLTVALAVTAGSVASGESNGGANIYLCQGTALISGPDLVQGAICSADSATCVALIDVPSADAAKLAAAAGSVDVHPLTCR